MSRNYRDLPYYSSDDEESEFEYPEDYLDVQRRLEEIKAAKAEWLETHKRRLRKKRERHLLLAIQDGVLDWDDWLTWKMYCDI